MKIALCFQSFDFRKLIPWKFDPEDTVIEPFYAAPTTIYQTPLATNRHDKGQKPTGLTINLMNFNKLSQIHPSIEQCKIHLHYSARSEEPYWLRVDVYLYKDNQRHKILFLGPGSKNEVYELYKQIEALGFDQSGQRFDYEWLVVTFTRVRQES